MGVFRFVDKIIKGSEYPWRYGFFRFDRRIISPLKKPWGFKYLIDLIKTITTQSDWQEGTLTGVEADTDALVLEEQYALEFDGENDYVDAGKIGVLKNKENFTVEFKIKPKNIDTTQSFVGQYEPGESMWFIDNDTGAGGIRFGFRDIDGGVANFSTSEQLELNEWTHVSCICNGTTEETKIYFDGALKADEVFSDFKGLVDTDEPPLLIGSWDDRRFADAFFSEVRIWNKALSQSEIQDNMNKRLTGDEEGLVGYWPMNEGSGSTVYDESTNNNDGTIHNATWTSSYLYPPNEDGEGTRTSPPLSLDSIKNVASSEITWTSTEPTDTNIKIECAVAEEQYTLEFDTQNDQVEYGTSPELQITGDLTIECWLYPTATDWGGSIVSNRTNATDNGLIIYGGGSSEDAVTWWYNGDLARDDEAGLTTNEWVHIACVFDSTNNKLILYYDGQEIATQDNVSALSDCDGLWRMSDNDEGILNYLYAIASDLRIWNTVRTQQEIQDNMNKQLTGNETGLVGYWPMNEGEGTTVYDESENNNDGEIEGAEWIEKEPFDEDYTEATSGEAIPGISAGDDLTGKYLWVRQTLSTSDPDTTPELDELKIEVYAYA